MSVVRALLAHFRSIPIISHHILAPLAFVRVVGAVYITVLEVVPRIWTDELPLPHPFIVRSNLTIVE